MEPLYRVLLRLYPARFRDVFAEEMLAVFQAARPDARARIAGRLMFYLREVAGLLRGACEEQLRAAGLSLFAPRRFTVRSTFRYPRTTIALMIVIFAVTVVAIEKATAISASMPRMNPHVPPIVPLPATLPQTLAIMFGITYIVAVIVWAVLHAMRRSGAHRLDDVQTWPQK